MIQNWKHKFKYIYSVLLDAARENEGLQVIG